MLETPNSFWYLMLIKLSDNPIRLDNQQETNGLIIIPVGSSETIRQRLIRYK